MVFIDPLIIFQKNDKSVFCKETYSVSIETEVRNLSFWKHRLIILIKLADMGKKTKEK